MPRWLAIVALASACGSAPTVGVASPSASPPEAEPSPPEPTSERATALDRDGDLIVDACDQCPDDPEDWNGHDDYDGCATVIVSEVDYYRFDPIVGFELGSARIPASARGIVADHAVVLADVFGWPTGWTVRVIGHAHADEPATLSASRSEAVARELALRGIERTRLTLESAIDDGEPQVSFVPVGGAPRSRPELVRPTEPSCPIALDADADGVVDRHDDCGCLPEDPDGTHDRDGCPELDDDLDFVLDACDPCPLEAETWDGIDDEGCPELDGPREILFDEYAVAIRDAERSDLDAMGALLRAMPDVSLRIIGRALPGEDARLAMRRAHAILDGLVDLGIAPGRITTESRPALESPSERRVTLRVEGLDPDPPVERICPTGPHPRSCPPARSAASASRPSGSHGHPSR